LTKQTIFLANQRVRRSECAEVETHLIRMLIDKPHAKLARIKTGNNVQIQHTPSEVCADSLPVALSPDRAIISGRHPRLDCAEQNAHPTHDHTPSNAIPPKAPLQPHHASGTVEARAAMADHITAPCAIFANTPLISPVL